MRLGWQQLVDVDAVRPPLARRRPAVERPNPSPQGPSAAALGLADDLNAAISAGKATFVVPAKEYLFSNLTWTIAGAHDMKIVFEAGASLRFFYGSGVRLKDLAQRDDRGQRARPRGRERNYVQGAVHAVNKAFVDISVDAAYLQPDTRYEPFSNPSGLYSAAKVAFWDASTRLMHNVGNQFMDNSTQLDGGLWRVTLKQPVHGAAVGDLITIFPRRGETWHLLNSSSITTKQVYIHAGGNMGFLEQLGAGGNVYDGVKIVRRPGSTDLLALNADGFHSSDVGVGPTLIDSEISFTGDDFLNILNSMNIVCDADGTEGTTLLMIDHTGGTTLAPLRRGDTLAYYHLNSLAKLADATVVSSERVSDAQTLGRCADAWAEMKAPPYSANIIIPQWHQALYRVTFSAPLPAAVATPRYNLANFEQQSAAGAVVSRNHFHDGFSRMGLLKAINLTYTQPRRARARPPRLLGAGVARGRPRHPQRDAAQQHFRGAPNGAYAKVDVMPGLHDVNCHDTTFVRKRLARVARRRLRVIFTFYVQITSACNFTASAGSRRAAAAPAPPAAAPPPPPWTPSRAPPTPPPRRRRGSPCSASSRRWRRPSRGRPTRGTW